MPRTSNLPAAATLSDVLGLEETSPSVKVTRRMAYDNLVADAAAAAGAGSVFGGVGSSHGAGLVPDPGASAATTERVLFDDSTWGAQARLRAALQYDPLTTSIPGSGYGGRVVELEDEGIVPDFLLNGSINPSPTNNSPALQAIFDDLDDFDTVIWPPGWTMLSARVTLPENVGGLRLVARGGYSNIVKNYNGLTNTSALHMIRLPKNTCYVERLWFWPNDGTSGEVAIGRVLSAPGDACEEMHFESCYFSRFNTGSFFGCLTVDGTQGTLNYGARRLNVFNTQFHGNYSGHGLRIGGMEGQGKIVGCDFVNGGASIADLYMHGISNNINSGILVTASSLDTVSMDWTVGSVFVTGESGDITITGNCSSNFFLSAFIGGTVTNQGTACRVETPLHSLLVNAGNDAAAAAAFVEIGEFYRNGSQVMVRVA